MKPYVYKIESKNGEYYYGVRWNYTGDPKNDLWINYFTSSESIKEKILIEGIEYFTPKVIKVFNDKESALDFEYNLIKTSINDKLCLNKSMGKCTIWDDILKQRVSNSMKNIWNNTEGYRLNKSLKTSGPYNPNYQKPSWRNVNSDIGSWMKTLEIYNDFLLEKWNLNKYGNNRTFLMKRYNICQGTARRLISKFKKNWNPYLDDDFMDFYKNGRML